MSLAACHQLSQVLMTFTSSDLWVHFFNSTPSSAKDTGKQVTLSYAVGKAAGSCVFFSTT